MRGSMFKSDPIDGRDYQIIALVVFLGLGIWWRDWTFDLLTLPCLLVTCLGTQWLWTRDRELNWKSPTITALSLSLLLRSNNLWIFVLAGVLGISSKFICQKKGKHWFNPANFGIVSVLSLTKDGWISPGQWGTDIWLALIFLALGAIILEKVGRLDTSLTFFMVYGALVLSRNIYLGWTLDVFFHQMMNGSLLLFALFMLTDPRSIPNNKSMRMLWASLIALVGFVIQFGFYNSTGVFYSLFLLSPLTIYLDRLENDPQFTWQKPYKLSPIVGN